MPGINSVRLLVVLLGVGLSVPVWGIQKAPPKPARKQTARRVARRPVRRAVKPKPPSPLANLPRLPAYLLPPEPEPLRAPSQCATCADRLLVTAYSLLGTPYRYGGYSPERGFDCSGFVRYVYQTNFPITLPPSAPLQYQTGVPLSRDELQPGDLVFFRHRRRGWHVGMYVGDGSFVHAPRRRKTVTVTPLDSPYFRTTYVGARRIPLTEPGAAGN